MNDTTAQSDVVITSPASDPSATNSTSHTAENTADKVCITADTLAVTADTVYISDDTLSHSESTADTSHKQQTADPPHVSIAFVQFSHRVYTKTAHTKGKNGP